MSIPTLITTGPTGTNDAAEVETNDRNISLAVQNLDVATNVAAHKGIRVFGGAGYLSLFTPDQGNWRNVIGPSNQRFFMSWHMFPSTGYEYLDMSAHAQPGGVFNYTEPATITIKLERSATVTGTYSSVGQIVLSAGSLSTYTTVDLSSFAIDATKPWHRVVVAASAVSAVGDGSWQNTPAFVNVNVRMKSGSVS